MLHSYTKNFNCEEVYFIRGSLSAERSWRWNHFDCLNVYWT